MKKGISLVALVITIIVLIILTGTVILTMGKNGIISKAQQAVSTNDIAVAKDKVILEMQTIKVNAEVEGKTVAEYLEENAEVLSAKGIEYEIAGSNITFTVDGKVDVVTDLNGKIQPIENPPVELVLGEAENEVRYGDKINYNVSLAPTSGSQAEGHLGNGWKIFYEDANYIYIIAEDYLHNSLLPTDLNMSTYDSYGSYWASTSNFTSTSSANILSSKAKQFGLRWLTSYSDSEADNAKATADLFHNAWTTKFGGGIAGLTCTAIGGPTLEMWIKSWNANSGTTATLSSSYSRVGYYVGISNRPSNSSTYNLSNDTGYTIEEISKLYFSHKGSFSDCNGYWLASPAANSTDHVMYVYYGGYVDNGDYYSYYRGIRPVVSILKSEIQISETIRGSKIWNVNKI